MTKPGYEVTYRDFLRLVSDPYCTAEVAPLLKRWFNYEIVEVGPPTQKGADPQTVLRDEAGAEVSKERLHLIIQADPEMQGSLYRTSQTLWR